MAKDSYTFDELAAQIKKGGSVLHEGRLIRTEADLRRAFETPEDIDGQIRELEARKAARSSGDDLESLTKAQLLERAAGLDVSDRNTKAEILEAINAAK